MDNYSMTPISWCCPNCGEVTSAFLNGKGIARKVCANCSTTVVLGSGEKRHIVSGDNNQFWVGRETPILVGRKSPIIIATAQL